MDPIKRGMRAKAILEDDVFKDAFDVLEKEQIGLFTDQVCTAEQLLEAHRMVRALRLLKGQLETVMTTGRLAERRIEKGQHRV